MKRWLKGCVIGSCVALASGVYAADVRVNGFLSVGGGILDSDNDQDEYEGFTDDFSFDADTIFALQVTGDISEKLSITGQIVARGEDDYDPELEWAYLSYQANENWKWRVGRLRAPYFMYSDFLEVGYAYPWIRPPVEVYGNIPFSGVDGVDVIFNTYLGDWDTTLQAYFGRNEKNFKVGGNLEETDIQDLAGIVLTLNYDWFTLRGGYHRADISANVSALDSFFASIGPVGVATLQAFDAYEGLVTEDDEASFAGIGISVDYNSFLWITEFTRLEFKEQLSTDKDSWYSTLGWRLSDEWMIHYTYAQNEQEVGELLAPRIPVALDPVNLGPLAAGVDFFQKAFILDSESHTIGLRYDFTPGAAFKLEYQQIEADYLADDETDLVSFVFDAVF